MRISKTAGLIWQSLLMTIDLKLMERVLRAIDDEVTRLDIDLSEHQITQRFADASNRGERDPMRLRALTLGIEAPVGSPLRH
jgi:hypothetical protein